MTNFGQAKTAKHVGYIKLFYRSGRFRTIYELNGFEMLASVSVALYDKHGCIVKYPIQRTQ